MGNIIKLKRCPLTGLPIITKPEWEYKAKDLSCSIEIAIIGDDILYEFPKGIIDSEANKWYVKTLDQIVKEYFGNKKINFIYDYSLLKNATLGAKKIFFNWMIYNSKKVNFIIVFGVNHNLRRTINMGKQLFEKYDKLVLTKSYEESINIIFQNKNINSKENKSLEYLSKSKLALYNILEEVQAQENKSREAKEQLETIIKGANLGWWDWDIPTGNEKYNEILAENLGYKLSEITPHIDWWEDRVHPDDVDQVNKNLQKHLDGETEYYKNKHRLKTKSGEWRWFSDFGKVVEKDDSGKPIRMIGILQDIDKEERAGQVLKQSEEKFRGLFNGMSLGVIFCGVIYDENNNIIDFVFHDLNKAFEKYINLKKENVVGRRFLEIFPEIKSNWLPTIEEVVRTGNPISCEIYQDSDKKYYSIYAYSNNKDNFVAILDDITEKKGNVLRIKHREAYLEALKEISEISFDKIAKEELQRFVTIIGKVANASRTYIFKNSKDENNELLMSQVAEYCAEGIEPQIDNPELQNLKYIEWFPRWKQILEQGDIISGRIADFPQKERDILEPQQIIRIIIIPIIVESTFWGFIGFDNCVNDRDWSDIDVKYLKTATGRLENSIQLVEKKKLLEYEYKRFKALSEATYEAIFITENEICIEVNKAACNMFGYSYEELIGISKIDLIADESKELVKNNMKICFKEPYEVIAQRKDGSKFYAEFQGRIYNYYGREVRITAVRDITKRKQDEQQIRKLSQVVKTTSQSVVISERNGKIIFINEALLKTAGFDDKSEIIGKSIYSFTDEQGATKLKQEIFPNLFEKGFYTAELKLMKKDSSFYPAEINCSIISDDAGNPDFFVAMFTDITKRKQAEEQIKKDLELQTALIQEIYHRTKNNMAVISAMLSSHARRSNNEYVKTIFKEIRIKIQTMSMVHQRLYNSKDLSSINLKGYLEDLTKLLAKNYYSVYKRLKINYDLQDVKVLIDTAIPIGLVLDELLSNIFKHAFPNNQVGEVHIRLFKEEDGSINIFLDDNGVGFPENFDPRGDNSMGLVFVYSIIERQLKGEVSVTSENGLTWHIKFKDDQKKERIRIM